MKTFKEFTEPSSIDVRRDMAKRNQLEREKLFFQKQEELKRKREEQEAERRSRQFATRLNNLELRLNS
jgi:hypothetical protein